MTHIHEIYETAEVILQVINDVFTEHGVELPDRQYIIAGDPAHDCAQLTVSFISAANGLPQSNMPMSHCDDPINMTYTIELIRELPQGSGGRNSKPIVPSPADLSLTAKGQMVDSRLLSMAAKRTLEATWLGIGAWSVQVGPPEGGIQAVMMEINMVPAVLEN